MNVDALIKSGDVEAIRSFMQENGLRLEGNKLVPKSAEKIDKLKALSQLNDSRQLAKKILLKRN